MDIRQNVEDLFSWEEAFEEVIQKSYSRNRREEQYMYCQGPSCLDCIFCLEGKRFRLHCKAILYLAE
jgi:hypothetical protein